VLLQLLTRQDEDAEEGEWNVSMAAGTCLSFLAQAVHDPIVPAVIPFIEANIKQENWHEREAAVMTFGSILVGPDPTVLTPLVNQALPILISMMSDPQSQVKDTTAWTLGRICESLITSIKPDVHLHALVSALVAGLQDSPHIIANCCWALMNLADGLYELYESSEEQNTGPLSPYFEGIVGALLQVTETYVIEPCFSHWRLWNLLKLVQVREMNRTIARPHTRPSRPSSSRQLQIACKLCQIHL
jgi:importin subunit beta-1